MRKKIVLVLLATVLALLFLSACDAAETESTPILLDQTTASDPFEGIPYIARGQDLLKTYLANTAQLTEAQYEFLTPKIKELYEDLDYDCSNYHIYYTLERAENGEVYLQQNMATETSMDTETSTGRIRCFTTAEVGTILVGIDTRGMLHVIPPQKDADLPSHLSPTIMTPAHYDKSQVEGACKLQEGIDGAMFFFPEERVVRYFFLNTVKWEYDYPILGEFVGRSDWENSTCFLTHDGDKVYVYDGKLYSSENDGKDAAEDCIPIFTVEGVESVEFLDTYSFGVRLHMNDKTVKELQLATKVVIEK